MKLFFSFSVFCLILSGATTAQTAPSCSAEKVTFAKSDFQVQVLKYKSHEGDLKSILIIPPTGGTNILDRSYGRTLCENGFDVFILEHWTDDNEYNLELQIHERFYARAQRSIGIVLDHVKSPFKGILGTSVGALHTAVAVNRYPALNAAFVITGGTSIAEIISHSDQDVLVEARKRRFEIYGFKNLKDYTEALEKTLSNFLLKPSSTGEIKRLGMIIASSDTTVPTKNQFALRDLWQPQMVFEMQGGHRFSIIKAWLFHRQDIVNFFKTAVLSRKDQGL